MALIPKNKYPSQTLVTDTAYPLGKARNVATPGDGSGTPWEADLINDLFGFQQALLDAGGVAASGAPDRLGASQYLDAIKAVIKTAMTKTVTDKHINTPLWVFKGNANTVFNYLGGADEFNVDDPRQYDNILIPLSTVLPDNAKITGIRLIFFSSIGGPGASVYLRKQTNSAAESLTTTIVYGQNNPPSSGYSEMIALPAGGVQLAGGIGCFLQLSFNANVSGKVRIARCLVSYSVTPS